MWLWLGHMCVQVTCLLNTVQTQVLLVVFIRIKNTNSTLDTCSCVCPALWVFRSATWHLSSFLRTSADLTCRSPTSTSPACPSSNTAGLSPVILSDGMMRFILARHESQRCSHCVLTCKTSYHQDYNTICMYSVNHSGKQNTRCCRPITILDVLALPYPMLL